MIEKAKHPATSDNDGVREKSVKRDREHNESRKCTKR